MFPRKCLKIRLFGTESESDSMQNTVVPRLSELVGPWVCSDNRKVRIIKAHSFIYRTLLNYSNRTHTLYKYSNRAVNATVRITKSSIK